MGLRQRILTLSILPETFRATVLAVIRSGSEAQWIDQKQLPVS